LQDQSRPVHTKEVAKMPWRFVDRGVAY